MANILNLAVDQVLTAPSPATSGTSLVLRSGAGAIFPIPPFYATASPATQLSNFLNSEIILVTAIGGDTLTITRAQKGTTARSIDVGWVIANGIYTDDVTSSSIVLDELLTGTPNGSLTAFTTASAFSSISVHKNGTTLHLTDDYTITGTNQITFVTAPATGAKLTATYIVGSSVMINGSNSWQPWEVPAGTVNGSNTSFTTARAYVPGSLKYYVNGILQQGGGVHFTETTPTTGVFTVSDAPLTGDNVIVSYQFVVSVSGNADTTDGIHASSTPTANQLLALDGNATYPQSAIQSSTLGYAQSTTIFTTSSTTPVQVTGLSVTVTVPAGGRRVKVSVSVRSVYSSTSGAYNDVSIWDGTVGTGTKLDETVNQSQIANGESSASMVFSHIPSSGSKTYNVGFQTTAGTANMSVGVPAMPMSILVELI